MDKGKLISLYCVDKKSLREIARMFFTNHLKIRRILKSLCISIIKHNYTKRIEIKCSYCQKPIMRYPSTLSTGKRGNFCSLVCIYSWQREGGMKGEKAPCWKGGITAISSNNLKTEEFRNLKKIVLSQYPLCAICGNDITLHVHHIKTRREYPELVFEISNLITLCRKCHSHIKGKEKEWEAYFTRIVSKSGELLGNPNEKDEGNQQPSQSNVIRIVDWKVQRLTAEDSQTNKADTSAAPERDEIVRAYGKP